MKQLKLIIFREYYNDVCSKSFWIGTLIVPIAFAAFCVLLAFLMKDSDTLMTVGSLGQEHDDLSGQQLMAMMFGCFMVMFIMIYGAQIFNKVKNEKTNRIMEIVATCVPGRTMMLGKIIAVGLTGLTQIVVWALLAVTIMVTVAMAMNIGLLLQLISSPKLWVAVTYFMLYFIGGFVLFGSLYSMVGAMTDRDNENQAYMAFITMFLLVTFYLAQYSLDNADSALSVWCSYIPFTSPNIGAVQAISGEMTWWQTIISLIILFATDWLLVAFAGKIYTSTMLLNGKKFTPKDIMTFLKSK